MSSRDRGRELHPESQNVPGLGRTRTESLEQGLNTLKGVALGEYRCLVVMFKEHGDRGGSEVLRGGVLALQNRDGFTHESMIREGDELLRSHAQRLR